VISTESTVYIVDDDPSVLKALERLLRSAGYRVESYCDPEAFLNRHEPERPGCLLLDLALPGLNGLELQQRIGADPCGLPIVFLTAYGDIPASVQAMKGGAVDFLTKPVDEQTLFAAVRDAIGRDATTRSARNELACIRQRYASLTPRELEVMRHVVAGTINKQIAAELGIAEKTIKVHRAKVMTKMQAGSLAELVRISERATLSSCLLMLPFIHLWHQSPIV
jgi:FixJ family two-component response regulator